LSSHILPEVEQVCERVIIINRGRIVAQDRTEVLRQAAGGSARLEVELKGDRRPILQGLGALPGALSVVEGTGAGTGSGPGAAALMKTAAGTSGGADEAAYRLAGGGAAGGAGVSGDEWVPLEQGEVELRPSREASAAAAVQG